MNRLLIGGAAALALAVAATSAVAQTAEPASVVDTVVNIPWGDWINAGANNAVLIIVALVGWALRRLPSNILSVIQTAQLDQLLYKAIDYAINKTAGAAKGQALSVSVGNDVLAKALQYAVNSAPAWMIQWGGGADGLRDKIIARLNLDAQAAIK